MDAEPLILSALNDFLYCPRRCALHRLEGLWEANAHTVSGELAHSNADDSGYRRPCRQRRDHPSHRPAHGEALTDR